MAVEFAIVEFPIAVDTASKFNEALADADPDPDADNTLDVVTVAPRPLDVRLPTLCDEDAGVVEEIEEDS